MDINILTSINDKILNMSLQPTFLNNEHVHYYVYDGGVEEHTANIEALDGKDNANELLLLDDPLIQLGIILVLCQFL